MESTKLITILKTFDESEWKDFNIFIKSIYFNRCSTVIDLYELLRKLSKKWDSKKLDKSYLFSKLFPGEIFSEKRLADIRYTLVKLIEEYWLINKPYQTSKKHLDLAIVYHKKSLNLYSEAYIEKSYKNLNLELMDATEYHKHLFDFHLTKHNLIEQEAKRNQEPNLQDLHNHLDAFYLCGKLKYYCKVLNYQSFRSHQYSIRMMDEVLAEAIQPQYVNIPSIQIYYHGVFTLLSLNNEKNFQALKKLLAENTQTFSHCGNTKYFCASS